MVSGGARERGAIDVRGRERSRVRVYTASQRVLCAGTYGGRYLLGERRADNEAGCAVCVSCAARRNRTVTV